jgi:hypothetical protein
MSSEQLLQLEIDFLPARYREECAQRKTHFLRVLSSVVFALVLLACAGWQWNAGRKLTLELEAIAPIHERAHERTVQLTTLKNELAAASDRAELLTYLRHPWPRTQLLAAVIEPMPESIKLSELTIGRPEEEEANAGLPSQNTRQTAGGESAAAKTNVTLSPTQADLKQLRLEFDARTTVVQMAGETTDVSELHEYLGQIALHKLILKAELRSIESGGRDSLATLFRARIELRPGYGQPNGPTQPVEINEPLEPAAGPTHQARQAGQPAKVGT